MTQHTEKELPPLPLGWVDLGEGFVMGPDGRVRAIMPILKFLKTLVELWPNTFKKKSVTLDEVVALYEVTFCR